MIPMREMGDAGSDEEMGAAHLGEEY